MSLDISGRLGATLRSLGAFALSMGILTMQRMVQRAAGLISLYFVVRHLSPADLGQYQFVTVVIATAAFLALPGLDNALMQSIARGSRGLYRRATSFSVRFSALGSFGLLVVAMGLRDAQPEMFAPLVVAALFFTPYTAMGQWKSLLLGESRFALMAVAEGTTALLTHAGLIVAVLLNVQDIWVFLLLFVAPSAVVNVTATLISWRRMAPYAPSDENDRLFHYGLESSAMTSVSMIAEQTERLAIFLLLSPATLAIYMAGDRLSELVRGVFQDAAAVLAPRFTRMSTYEGRIERAIWVIGVIAGVAILLFALTLAPAVLLLIFGQAYAPSIPYAQALLCSVAIGNIGQFQFRFIRSQPDSLSFRTITLWTSAVRIVGSFVLVALFGVWGAVAALIGHRLALSIISSAVIRRRYRTAPAVPSAEGSP